MHSEEISHHNFYQAVRSVLLRHPKRQSSRCTSYLIGSDTAPQQEPLRFTVQTSLAFPAAPITQIESSNENANQKKMEITFMGLTGAMGVLPDHYTAFVMSRLQAKDPTAKDFFDLFSHRAISFLYRAWEKYRPYIRDERGDNYLDGLLLCFMGHGTDGLQQRLSIPDKGLIYYASLFMHHPRNAITLEMMLADYMKLPVKIEQFQGRWVSLSPQKRPQLRDPRNRGKFKNSANPPIRLGVNAILGDRVWSIQNKFRVRVGPLTYEQFERLLPEPKNEQFFALAQLTRIFVGHQVEFDVQLVLKADQVPFCMLGGEKPMRLGWNSWLKTEEFQRDAEDAVFEVKV
jgi:type VI secretion system protein ImpH